MRKWWALVFVGLLLPSESAAPPVLGTSQPAPAPVGATLPANPRNGDIAIRNRDLFFYSGSLVKWLGERMVIQANRGAANASGMLRFGESAGLNALPYDGFQAPSTDSLRIMEVRAHSADVTTVAACTTFVFSDSDTILKLIWETNEERWIPGGAGWVSPDTSRVAIGPGKTLTLATGAGGAVLPDFPQVWLFLREEIAP